MTDDPKIKFSQSWDDWNAMAEAVVRQASLEGNAHLMHLGASIFRSIGLSATAGCTEESARRLAASPTALASDREPIP